MDLTGSEWGFILMGGFMKIIINMKIIGVSISTAGGDQKNVFFAYN